MDPIDLRSDTVTRPSPGMRAAMAAAEVGDDQYGEDPTVNRLQERVAELLGKEAALWVPSGTMANQVALRVLTRPGDDVIVARESHAMWHETGAAAANAGIQFTEVGRRHLHGRRRLLVARKPRGHLITRPPRCGGGGHPQSAGGVVFPAADAAAIGDAARERDVASHSTAPGSSTAAIAGQRSPATAAAPFDLVSIALSKGLGAPGGSVLAGGRDHIAAAIRYRRMSGGAMRQVGIFAAAGLFALEHNIERLAQDHANARLIADRLAASHAVILDPASVRTNILLFHLREDGPDAPTVVDRARDRGVSCWPSPRTRAVTHLDVTAEDVPGGGLLSRLSMSPPEPVCARHQMVMMTLPSTTDSR
jgi:threonine aldolase